MRITKNVEFYKKVKNYHKKNIDLYISILKYKTVLNYNLILLYLYN